MLATTWMEPNLGTLGPGLLIRPWWDAWTREAASLKMSLLKQSVDSPHDMTTVVDHEA